MAKKMIISAVSALTAPGVRPPQFAVDPTENKMEASKDKAPVLLRIESTGTIDGKAFALKMSETSEIGVEENALYLNALGEVLTTIAADAQNVDLGFARAELSISGSLEHGDDPAITGEHQAQYTLIPNEAMKARFAAIECHVPADACPASVKRIRDVETGDNAIHGRMPFYLEGVKMTYGGTGEKLELLAADGKTFVQTLEVVEHTSEVKIKAKLTARVETGRYFVALTTLAGGTSTLWPIGCYTTVVDTEDPFGLTSSVNKNGAADTLHVMTDQLTVKGHDLSGATLELSLYDAAGVKLGVNPWDDGNEYEIVDDETIKVTLTGNGSSEPDGSWTASNREIRLVARKDGQESYLVLQHD